VVVVITWNVENLFSPGADGSAPTTAEAYARKLDALAETITASASDVVALQEVGDAGALGDLVDRLDGQWHTELSNAPDGRGIAVAFVSRLAMTDRQDVVALPDDLAGGRTDDAGGTLTRLGRGALAVTVTTGGTDVRLLTCHLKSKLLTYPGGRFAPRTEDERARYGVYALGRRAAESGAVRMHANAHLDGQGRTRALVVLGDLNDTPDAATTQMLLGPGGSEIGTPGERIPDKGDAFRLWNLAALIPADQRFTRVYRGRPELIDHILISRALLERVVEVRTVVQRPAADLPSVTDEPAARRDEPGSDHAPVVATFDLT